ncbi:hypothetical protein RUM43_005952, partial [Polyplax serrata]
MLSQFIVALLAFPSFHCLYLHSRSSHLFGFVHGLSRNENVALPIKWLSSENPSSSGFCEEAKLGCGRSDS